MKPRIIAKVAVREPDGDMTREEWIAWRRSEDERMQLELAEQLVAHIERESDATEH
jgi:hypothetical protein